MLISNVLEKTPAEAAWQLCADKLADWVRTSYLEHLDAGARQWEDAMHEDPAALIGLREEGFGHIVGLDYILKWWGNSDSEELAGQLDVIWKVMEGEGISCYKSWIKLAERDFILGVSAEKYFGGGKIFEIEAKGASEDNKYIQHAELNGQVWNKPWFSHADIAEGGKLTLIMGNKPNKDWGNKEVPPSAQQLTSAN